jgi:DNA-binding response OmpR family regulator
LPQQNRKIKRILVVSANNELPDLVKEASASTVEIIHAINQQQGLDMARKEFPDVIVLGYLEPGHTAFQLHQKLREGWITKNIPLLLVDINPQDPSKRVMTMEEGLQIEADEYIALTGNQRTLGHELAEPISRLTERLRNRLRERVNIFEEVILSPGEFAITWEQIPGRGAFEMQQEELIKIPSVPLERAKFTL